ncbi:hypothetical protein NU195Hw_g1718t1 [Hortaea werneckii]
MSVEHELEVCDVMRQVLGEMKGINNRLERIETRQKQIEGKIAILVADENLEKMATPQTATKLQTQLSMRNQNAADGFFSIPELLESTLLELPMQDLLLAQRVCSRFKATIDWSIKIRRALFFEPEPVAKEGVAGTPRVNPLLTDESQLHRRRFIITKALFYRGPRLPISIMVKVKDKAVVIERKRIPLLQDATYFSHGSWRKMLAVQSLETALLVLQCSHRVYMPVPLGAPLTMEEVCNRTQNFG